MSSPSLESSENVREQPVATLPVASRRPIRRGMRLNRSASSTCSSNEACSSQEASSQQKGDVSSSGYQTALFSGVHSSAASSTEDALRRLKEMDGIRPLEEEHEHREYYAHGSRKKAKFSITALTDDDTAFAPYQSVVEDEEEVTGIASSSKRDTHMRTERRSPTPPPEFDSAAYARSASTHSCAMRNLNDTLGALRRSAPVVGEVLPDTMIPTAVPVVENDLLVKIRHKGVVNRISLKKTARVAELVNQFAQNHSLAPHLVTLWKGDDTLSPEHTLQQAGVLLTDILDCSVSSEDTIVQDGTRERNMISLKVQDKAKSYVLCIGKSQRLADLLALYCEKSGNAPANVTLVFDGDKIDLSESPADLDMDNDDVVDARLV
ncbi:NFATC2-interacting protein-like [Sycon ciliatum]|uniref:NFATC2-interacting protein-like n=1 Tax=Sycon ciliatum TaxID=27933 RepID=UPI0031F60580